MISVYEEVTEEFKQTCENPRAHPTHVMNLMFLAELRKMNESLSWLAIEIKEKNSYG